MPEMPPQADLSEQLRHSLRERWQQGEQVSAEQLLASAPADSIHDELILDLLYEEHCLRQEYRVPLSAEDYQARFPHLASSLRDLFDLESMMESGGIEQAFSQAVTPTMALNQLQEPTDSVQSDVTPLAPASREALLGIGTELGEYVIQATLGQGGMGQVFKALHRRMKRTVAIKVLAPHLLRSPDALNRFQREVEAAAQLSHSNIVTAFDAREDAGVRYLVTEYIDGDNLSDRVRRQGPLSVIEAVRITSHAAEALGYAHANGLIHRDVKPANLMVDRQGRFKLLDLGLARNLADQTDPAAHQLTGSGAVLGTVDFLAPEQAQDTHGADARADIYGLGCTLYFLLTGQVPFPGQSMVDKLVAHRLSPPPSLATLRDDVPAELDQLVQRMMAKRPEDRHPTMADVIADLQRVGAPTTLVSTHATSATIGLDLIADPTVVTNTSAAPQGTVAPAASSSRRPPVIRKLLLAGMGAIFAWAFWQIIIVRDNDGNEVARIKVPEGGKVEVQGVEAQKPNSGMGEMPAAIETAWQPIPVGESPFDKLDPAAIPPEERFSYQPKELVAVIGSHHRRQWYPGAWLTWSPDGKWLASVSRMGTGMVTYKTQAESRVYLWNASTRKLAMLIESVGNGPVYGCAFTPDSKRLAIASDKDIRLFDFTAEKPGYVTWCQPNGPDAIPWANAFAIQIAQDGKTLAGAQMSPSSEVRIWDLSGPHPRLQQALKSDGFSGYTGAPFDMTPDGKTIAFCANKPEDNSRRVKVFAWDGKAYQERDTIPSGPEEVVSCGLSPNGHTLAVAGMFATAYQVYDLKSTPAKKLGELPNAKGSGNGVSVVRIFADGKTVAIGGHPGGIRFYKLAEDGGFSAEIVAHFKEVSLQYFQPLVFGVPSPNQHELAAFHGSTLAFFKPPEGKLQEIDRPVRGFTAKPVTSYMSRNRGLLAIQREDDVAQVWTFDGPTPRPGVNDGRSEFGVGTPVLSRNTAAMLLWKRPTTPVLDLSREGTPTLTELKLADVNAFSFSNSTRRGIIRLMENNKAGAWALWQMDQPLETAVTLNGVAATSVPVVASPDGRWIAATGEVKDTFDLWELRNGGMNQHGGIGQRGKWKGLTSNFFSSPTFSPDSRLLVTWANIFVLGDSDPQTLTLPAGWRPSIKSAAFTPDGRRVLVANEDGWVTAWDTTTWTKVWETKLPGLVAQVIVADDSRHLFTCNGNGTIYVLRVPELMPVPAVPPEPAEPPPEEMPEPMGQEELPDWNFAPGAPPPAVVPFDAQAAAKHQADWAKFLNSPVELENKLGMKFRLIPPGEFETTNSQGQPRKVRVTKPYYLGATEVTVGQFRAFVNETKYVTDAEHQGQGYDSLFEKKLVPKLCWHNPGYPFDDNTPVTLLSSVDALAYCAWLSNKEQATYQIPQEHLWEFAARAGALGGRGGYPVQDPNKLSWFRDNLPGGANVGPQGVGQKTPNHFGLVDCLGNVSELCRKEAPYVAVGDPRYSFVVSGQHVVENIAAASTAMRARYWLHSNPSSSVCGIRLLRGVEPGNQGPFSEPILLRRNEPMGPTALVSQPAPIKGLRSWSVEMRLPLGQSQLVWSPDGKWLASADGTSNQVRILDDQGNVQRVLAGFARIVQFVAWSKDNQWVAASDYDHVYLFETSNWTCRAKIWQGSVKQLVFSRDARYLLIASGQHFVELVDLTTGAIRNVISGLYESACWSPDSRRFALGSRDAHVRIFDASSLKEVAKWKASSENPIVNVLGWIGQSNRLVTQAAGGDVQVWNVETQQSEQSHKVTLAHPIWSDWSANCETAMFFHPTGSGNLVTFWDWVGPPKTLLKGIGRGCAWSPDGSTLVTRDARGLLQFRDAKSGDIRHTAPEPGRANLTGDPWRSSLFGKEALLVTRFDPSIGAMLLDAWDSKTGKPLQRGTPIPAANVAPSPDGSRLLCWFDKKFWLLDGVTGKTLHSFPALTKKLQGVRWSYDNKRVATWDDEFVIRIWNAESRKEELALKGHTVAIHRVAWSPDGAAIVSFGAEPTMRIWKLSDPEKPGVMTEFPEKTYAGKFPQYHDVVWTPDGKQIVTRLGDHGSFQAWSLDEQKWKRVVDHGGISGNYVAPNGRIDFKLIQWSTRFDFLDTGDQYQVGIAFAERAEAGRQQIAIDPAGRRAMIGPFAFDLAARKRGGTLLPSVGENEWLCVGPTGHYRGGRFDQSGHGTTAAEIAAIEPHLVYVAQTDAGEFITLSPAEFQKRFGWKNDPQQASLCE